MKWKNERKNFCVKAFLVSKKEEGGTRKIIFTNEIFSRSFTTLILGWCYNLIIFLLPHKMFLLIQLTIIF